MFREGTALEALESVDSRRYLPAALVATLLTIAVPALVVVALSPLSGLADLLLSALLATGLSVAAGSAGAALWTRLPQAREIPFGDLMLWAWARRVRAERRLARTAACETPLGTDRDLGALRRLAVVFEARDGFNHGHSGRVARHAERIARRMGLPEDEVERIEAAAAVHDIGKVSVPRAVLARHDSELSAEERALVRRQAVAGAERAAAVDPDVAALVRHQYERVDGGGSPDGLAGDGIPLGARIIAVANRFDELTSLAPGSAPRSRRNALDELSARAGSELDAGVVAAFAAYYSGSRSIAGVALAATAPQRAARWIAAAPATIGSAGAPAVLQGACAAGTAALATACIAGLPAATPDRDGEARAAAQQRSAERGASAGGAGGLAPGTPLADAPTGSDQSDERAAGREPDGGGSAPPSSRSEPPASGGGQGGGAPTTPQPTAPRTGGGGGAPPASDGGGGGGGTTAPPKQVPSQPTAPTEPAPQTPVEVPQAPAAPVSQVIDPVLDGVGEAVPPIKPVTEAVKGLVGGLTGGGGSR